jgi:hypothetical protein
MRNRLQNGPPVQHDDGCCCVRAARRASVEVIGRPACQGTEMPLVHAIVDGHQLDGGDAEAHQVIDDRG